MRALVGYGTRYSGNNNLNRNQENETPKDKKLTNAPATTAQTRARPLPNSQRPALQSRDHNAMMRAQKGSTPLTAKSGNANMPPYEKHHASRPLMPTLSASAKAPGRAPLTPRVAGTGSPAVSTPLSRRAPPRSESNTTPRDEISTPVSSFLNSNITPRSGSRKHRVDSANTTPTGTPNGTPAPPANDSGRFPDAPVYGSGLGIAGMEKDAPKRPTVSFNPTVSDLGSSRSPVQSNSVDSKFFFASDAKPTPAQRPPMQAKTSSFFYASGDAIPQQPQSSSASAVGSLVGDEHAQPKFFHANGTPDLQLSPSPHFPPPKGSSVVSNSRMTSPRLATASPGTLSPPQRPSSPTKLAQHTSVPSLRSTPSLPSPVLPRPQAIGRGQSANNIVAARRASIETTSRVVSHSRSASLGSPPPIRKVSGGSSGELVPPSTPLNLITTSVPVSTPEEEPHDVDLAGEEVPKEGLPSPTKTGQTLEQLNELAANARRERKVLDLEITNSSLAAINRTLEREMRKQTAELRRYRRLSRSGRLSIATSASMRTSGTLSAIDGSELSELSEGEEDEEEEGFSEDDSEASSSEASSPSALAESDLRHRKRDEKRLQLDLSKHQQLLIDSQKMNQSLKRCLGWTEELITEGRKALEYQVRVSDVELGGRVLAIDEQEGEDNEGMSDIGASMLREARLKAAGTWGAGVEAGDRDSGIEVDSSHPEPYLSPPSASALSEVQS